MAIHKIKIFSGRGSEYLAEKIAASFGTTLGQSEVLRFSDGEFQPCYNESIRGCTVFIIQSTFPPSDNLMELLMMIDAARRASAYKVVAVIPYFGWARQDRKDRPRVPIGAKLVANLLMAAGVDRVMTMDLHADQIQGFFDVPVDALYASGIFIPYIESLKIEDLSIAAPDMGGAKRANTYAKLLGTPIIISHKERAKANVVGKMTAIGEVEGRNILIVDDMIDTAGTICMAADMLMSRGAKSVRAAITHPVLSGPAYERINDSALEEVIVTDTIPLNPDKDLHKFTVLTIADMFADVIERVHNYKEISSIFFKSEYPGRRTGSGGMHGDGDSAGALRRRFGRNVHSEKAIRQRCGSAEIRPAHCSGDSTGNSKEKIRRKCVSEPERISQTVQGGTHHKCVPLFSAGRGRFRKFLLHLR